MGNYDADPDEWTGYDHHATPSPQDEMIKEKLDQMNPQRFDRDNFLNAISQIESSGGKNINHPISNAPLHRGQQAVGQYGLMPNTINEMAHREGRNPASVAPGSSEERAIAEQLADRVLNRFPNTNEAAYAWHSGHNLTPQQIEQRGYLQDPYVQKFQKIWAKMGYK